MRRTKKLIFMMLAMVLCASLAAADERLRLALDLFGEGDWDSCRRECRRVLISSPDLTEARVLAATCSLRLGRGLESSLRTLEQIAADEGARLEMRSLAAYEAGREHWRVGELETAYARFAFAFLHSKSDAVFLRSGCSLFLLMNADKSLRSKSASIYAQIRSARDLYDWNLQKECMPAEEGGTGIFSKPGEWVVDLYRGQIAPAIGMRCSCIPSCSEYFLQACRKHGLLGFPLQADRFFREPSIVQQQLNPVVVGEQIKYSDPVGDHDYWIK